MNLARIGNKYLADQEPWKLVKQDPIRVKTIINTALQIAAALAILSEPLLPFLLLKNEINAKFKCWLGMKSPILKSVAFKGISF